MSFAVGDIIEFLNEDEDDAGWWRGKLHGKIGLFPSDAVKLYVESQSFDSNSPANKDIGEYSSLICSSCFIYCSTLVLSTFLLSQYLYNKNFE